mmetsp:Transcript_48539/g.139383  ORF Transcript_48539/g.139383 Transcript_48539/m.139383 type:complete len:203 (-) Transcript_48539:528-1136(-)
MELVEDVLGRTRLGANTGVGTGPCARGPPCEETLGEALHVRVRNQPAGLRRSGREAAPEPTEGLRGRPAHGLIAVAGEPPPQGGRDLRSGSSLLQLHGGTEVALGGCCSWTDAPEGVCGVPSYAGARRTLEVRHEGQPTVRAKLGEHLLHPSSCHCVGLAEAFQPPGHSCSDGSRGDCRNAPLDAARRRCKCPGGGLLHGQL